MVTKLCLTLCNPMDGSPPCYSVHGILQARILEWVAIPFSRGSSQPRDRTHVSCLAGRFFTTEPPGRHPTMLYLKIFFFFFFIYAYLTAFSFFLLSHPFKKIYYILILLFIYLAVLGLSCAMWDLVPWPGMEPCIGILES